MVIKNKWQQKMLSDQPLTATAKAKRKRNKYVDHYRYNHFQKPVQDTSFSACTTVLCRTLLAAFVRWLAVIPLLLHFYGAVFCCSVKRTADKNPWLPTPFKKPGWLLVREAGRGSGYLHIMWVMGFFCVAPAAKKTRITTQHIMLT
jgi:hypothetical protein